MPWFIKKETFTKETLNLSLKKRKEYLREHKKWIDSLISSGEKVYSGYLTNENKEPGGGGLLIIKSKSYKEAKKIIEQDPMITNNLVIWDLHEWFQVSKKLNLE